MFFDEGKEWGRTRRLISPNIAGHNVKAMMSYISKVRNAAAASSCEVVLMQDTARAKFDPELLWLYVLIVPTRSYVGSMPQRRGGKSGWVQTVSYNLTYTLTWMFNIAIQLLT